MPSDYQIVLNTCPDVASAEQLASELINQGIAACVNIIPEVRSFYRWQGQVESSQEILLLIKSHKTDYPSIQKLILEQHPYELPEIIAVPITQGFDGYLGWLNSSRHSEGKSDNASRSKQPT